MATNYNPKTNNNGLVLCLDAANPKSYSGSGSTFTDISKTKINATITGTTYDSSAKAFTFASSSDYITTGTSYVNTGGEIGNGDIAYTIEALVKIDGESLLGTNILSDGSSIIGQNNAGGIGLQVYKPASGRKFNFGARSNDNFDSNSTFQLGVWYHVVATREVGVNNYIYINGVEDATYTSAQLDVNSTVTTMRMGYAPGRIVQPLDGQIALVRLYNTHFTPEQVKINYNAVRGRFGL